MFVLVLLLSLIILISQQKKEYYTNKTQLILLGDSIFDNGKYVGEGNSIKTLLKNKYSNSIIMAKDESKIASVYYQFNKIQFMIKKPCKIFLSIGGNNILEQYKKGGFNNTSILDNIFQEYITLIQFLNKPQERELILFTIYYPNHIDYEDYYKLITNWNNKLINLEKLKILKLLK